MRTADPLLALVRRSPVLSFIFVALLAMAGWVFWPGLVIAADKWSRDPQYSHGFLVPIFSLVLLWLRRERLAGVAAGPSWVGLPFILLSALIYVVGGYIMNDTFQTLAFIPATAGIVGLFGGWAAIRWAAPSIAFLMFMVPLPYQIEIAMGQPLRRLATILSVTILQTLGFPTIAEGNIIVLEKGRVAVVDACNGLSMLLTFVAMAVGMVMVVRKPWLDKVIILVSAPVIAVLANVMRITANGIAVDLWGPAVANKWFHDQAGLIMMPTALIMLLAELWFLGRLFEPAPDERSPFSATLKGAVKPTSVSSGPSLAPASR